MRTPWNAACVTAALLVVADAALDEPVLLLVLAAHVGLGAMAGLRAVAVLGARLPGAVLVLPAPADHRVRLAAAGLKLAVLDGRLGAQRSAQERHLGLDAALDLLERDVAERAELGLDGRAHAVRDLELGLQVRDLGVREHHAHRGQDRHGRDLARVRVDIRRELLAHLAARTGLHVGVDDGGERGVERAAEGLERLGVAVGRELPELPGQVADRGVERLVRIARHLGRGDGVGHRAIELGAQVLAQRGLVVLEARRLCVRRCGRSGCGRTCRGRCRRGIAPLAARRALQRLHVVRLRRRLPRRRALRGGGPRAARLAARLRLSRV